LRTSSRTLNNGEAVIELSKSCEMQIGNFLVSFYLRKMIDNINPDNSKQINPPAAFTTVEKLTNE
jgi:hypothetical protein